MRISDWSSDVCSSDLAHRHHLAAPDQRAVDEHVEQLVGLPIEFDHARFAEREQFAQRELGRSDLDRQLDVDILEQLEIRSEEHTSELQSLMRSSYAVFCLKKKKKPKLKMWILNNRINNTHHQRKKRS